MTSSIWSTVVRITGALFVVALVAIGVGCADLAEPVEDFYHPADWTEPGGENFHGAVVLESANGAVSCESCHGVDYEGEELAPACSECHASYPHADGWLNPQSEVFHGTFVLESSLKAEACQSCHGEDYAGGSSGVACADCHSIYPHEMAVAFGGNPRSAHRAYMRDVAKWDLSTCQTCHGSGYDGNGIDYDGDGTADKTCLTCHGEPEGPEACDTCHGDTMTGAPPPDLFGETATTARGVGAHDAHTALAGGFDACVVCHEVPATYDAPGHIGTDAGRAEIVFGGLAVHRGAMPSYDSGNGTCSGTYCHGDFSFAKADAPIDNRVAYQPGAETIDGNDAAVTWTQVGTGEAMCGTCHGLPPTGHVDRGFPCQYCHNIYPDGHLNGKVDVYGTVHKKTDD